MEYTAEQLIRLARRDNNSKRPYLFVNSLQGKHIPADPEKTGEMCRALAEKINAACPGEKLYVIGFAETATGIAACACSHLPGALYYQQTTREGGAGENLLFSESHSHATEQLLRAEGLAEALRGVDRVILIDDEVTTGNTMCKLIALLREKGGAHARYSIASVLNSMTEERLEELRREGTECLYLCRVPFEYGKESILDVPFDPERHLRCRGGAEGIIPEIAFSSPVNPRNLVRAAELREACAAFTREVCAWIRREGAGGGRVLVAGTEEFMYPTITVGQALLREGLADTVRIHSTTRSPIVAAAGENYPLFCRAEIRSAYDPERTTYLYNLREYDRVLVLTDAPAPSPGLWDLYAALRRAGNRRITAARWEYTGGQGKV